MIPYWLVLYEFRAVRLDGTYLRDFPSYAEAQAWAERVTARKEGTTKQHRATISGPFYRDGF